MAFNKKTWKNRISEFFNRYRVENVQTGAISTVYMNLDDGVVTQEGDVIDADTMNDLENRIDAAIGKQLSPQTLAVGDTTLIFSDESITTDSTIEPYASIYGVAPTMIEVTTGQAVVTFNEQDEALSFFLVIK